MVIHERDIILRPLTLEDCTANYVEWLNDPEVNRYLETRWRHHTLADVRDFVASINTSEHSKLFGIVFRAESRHIGNIKIGPLNPIHRYADISYFIGDRNFWGKGLATQAIRAICRYGFENLKLESIQAGVYGGNTGSARALEKVGFVHVGSIPQRFISGEDRDDHILYHLSTKALKQG